MTNLPNNIVKKIEEASMDITTSKFDTQNFDDHGKTSKFDM
jgi:hypothetical protein